MTPEISAKLREPFPPEKIGKLPRVTCGNCRESRSRVCDQHKKARCDGCGAWITSAHIHLDYVGHADTTDRLLEADSQWTWEPFALDQRGLPLLDDNGGMWIRLTVAGVTRIGYGHADGKSGGDAVKETIGDCLLTGTPIVTARGTIPIERVRVGDLVPTRQGWRTVTDHWRSTSDAPVVAVLLVDGRVLVGTPHHRVPTANGLQRIGALRNGDMLYTWQDTVENQAPKRSSGMDAGIGDCPTIPIDTDASTTWPRLPLAPTCIGTSTSRSMAQRRMAGTCTTLITIQITTIPQTSLQCRQQSMPSTTVTDLLDSSARVMSAAAATSLSGAGRDGARPLANSVVAVSMALPMSHLARAAWPSCASATSAAQASLLDGPGPSSAHLVVVALADAGRGEVWNLSVGEVHEYVANGVYVHNSIRNGAMRFGVGLDLWRKEVHVDEPATPRQRRLPPKPPAPIQEQIVARAREAIAAAVDEETLHKHLAQVVKRESEGAITLADSVQLRRHIAARLDQIAPAGEQQAMQTGVPPGDHPVKIGRSHPKHKAMGALWRQVGLDGTQHREDRLAKTSLIVGRDVDSSADLTVAEADTVIDVLEAELRKAKKEKP